MTMQQGPEMGQEAPDFTLPAYGREAVSLRQYRGRPVVLAFYVLDFTGG